MISNKTHGKYISLWYEFWAILHAFNRRSELQRLVIWAKRKRLSGPRKLYQNRFADEERRLFVYTLSSPRLTKVAHLLHWLNHLISTPPLYPAKGSAPIYRSRIRHKPRNRPIVHSRNQSQPNKLFAPGMC